MLDYETIKATAKTIGRPVKDLLALSNGNDPFYAGVGHRRQEAEWFAQLWHDHGIGQGVHLRRIHYHLVSQAEEGVQLSRPDGREYLNTDDCWQLLGRASLAARYLDMVPFNALVDRRNDEPMIFAPLQWGDPRRSKSASCSVFTPNAEWEIDLPEDLSLPRMEVDGLGSNLVEQDFIIEVWIEKSTQNDWLVPLCKRRGVNLVVGIGEQSETRSRELALRARDYGPPVRVIYISDFDPGGQSMPKAVARKVEFTIAKFGLNVDIQVIPLALSADQCAEYRLPRTPIKETERRKDRFEAVFGVGATELDAMEAKHPGEMAGLLNAEIDRFIDQDLKKRTETAYWDQRLQLRKTEEVIREKYTEDTDGLLEELEVIRENLDDWMRRHAELWSRIADEMEDHRPDLSHVEVPRSEAPGETDRFVLFDSRRDYFSQMDAYNAWRDGEA